MPRTATNQTTEGQLRRAVSAFINKPTAINRTAVEALMTQHRKEHAQIFLDDPVPAPAPAPAPAPDPVQPKKP